MTILPLDPLANASPEALLGFLAECRSAAQRDQRPKLASITITVDALDPLAVLEAIFEPTQPHFYAERPSLATAVAGAEAAVAFTAGGPERFAEVQRFVDDVLANTLAVGDVESPFGGPHFFSAFAFAHAVPANAAFAAAQVFVPQWQVARAGAVTTAVANLWITPDAALAPLAERIWRAHTRFRRFDYAAAEPVIAESNRPATSQSVTLHETGDYRAAVREALRRLDRGEFNKIVLARALEVQANGPLHPLRLLNSLRQRFPDCYAFSVANGHGDSFIGASPERLVRVSGGRMETDALAGTVRRGGGAAEDAALGANLLRSEKDRREQRLVLESIQRRLAPLGLELEHPAEPVLLRLANVQHLHTPVRARMSPTVRLLDVLARLHPTPAVGGTPREAALAAIPSLEGFHRGLYAGTVGWLNARGGGEFLVGIRSALVRDSRATVYAGAGIVAGSDPDREFAETELKFRALLDGLLA